MLELLRVCFRWIVFSFFPRISLVFVSGAGFTDSAKKNNVIQQNVTSTADKKVLLENIWDHRFFLMMLC